MRVLVKEKYLFQKKILTWYEKNKRDLPWRRVPFDTRLGARDPYKILLSEVMLQQTQVSRVMPKYERWLQAFPTVQDVARASTREVLEVWSGLGYNRRALYLQKTAKEVVKKYHGVFPRDEKTLQTLPGIGKYTAGALACFAFDQQVAVVDTNIKKVILTQFAKTRVLSEKEIHDVADQLLPHEKAYEWNQALMDYSSTLLKKEKIVIPKQSRFIGSERYYRGQIVKLLVREKNVRIADLPRVLNVEDQRKIEKILRSLMKEGLVEQNNGSLTIP